MAPHQRVATARVRDASHGGSCVATESRSGETWRKAHRAVPFRLRATRRHSGQPGSARARCGNAAAAAPGVLRHAEAEAAPRPSPARARVDAAASDNAPADPGPSRQHRNHGAIRLAAGGQLRVTTPTADHHQVQGSRCQRALWFALVSNPTPAGGGRRRTHPASRCPLRMRSSFFVRFRTPSTAWIGMAKSPGWQGRPKAMTAVPQPSRAVALLMSRKEALETMIRERFRQARHTTSPPT